jgi:glycosyltransferase involved in cell wall biosynthesis
MRIVFFTHPNFMVSQSMPRFSRILADGMRNRNHDVEVWTARPFFFKLPLNKSLKKWMGYIDQFVLFPIEVKNRLKKYSPDTLFVFTDQALGPWVPLVIGRRSIIHCHDLLAQMSANGEILENQISYTGKKYQLYIQNGYKKGRNFISVSQKTRSDLHRFLDRPADLSDVVYNGLDPAFKPLDPRNSRSTLSEMLDRDLINGYILHIGGNQWYKNRLGVISIYETWRNIYNNGLPLILIGPPPNDKLRERCEQSVYKDDIVLLSGKDDHFVKQAYSGASIFLFPSLAEGFGWPIAEAMAMGVPVITTNQAPMTEVGGDAAIYIDRYPLDIKLVDGWNIQGARALQHILTMSVIKRAQIVDAGFLNVEKFNSEEYLERIEAIYLNIVASRDFMNKI